MTGEQPNSGYSRDELVDDAETFARTLEAAHPDPYSGHGGRVAFHRRLAELVRNIPDGGEPLPVFHRRLQRFAAHVQDGHTAVQPPEDGESSQTGRLPLALRVIGDGLYVEAVYENSLTPLLGGRLLAVDGVPVETLRERHKGVASADNRFGRLTALAAAITTDPAALARLLEADPTSPTVTVETTDDERVTRAVDLVDDAPVATLDRAHRHPETAGQPAFDLWDDGRTALLRIPNCTAHREHHEVMVAVGRDGDGISDSAEAYRRLVGEPVPADPDERIAELPAASDVLRDLVEAMADAGTEQLIVDVRGNTGGSSIVPYLLVYALHGWDGVVEAVGDQYDVTKISELAREELSAESPLGEPDTHGGFDFDSYFKSDEAAAAMAREQFTQLSSTLAAALDDDDLAGRYCPENVAVVTDAETFSAGVEPAILLSKLGADVVGVPAGQSPNGPREALLDELPNTELDYHLSMRHHVFLPAEEGDVLTPDVPLTPERFRALDCAADASLVLALAHFDDELPASDS